jgi:four helix bundle protein
MTNEEVRPFDIKERTLQFAIRVVKFVNILPKDIAINELGRQLLRAGTSVGANLEEADGAESRQDFIHKLGIARKEARETRFWLKVLMASGLVNNDEVQVLYDESDQLIRILSKMTKTALEKEKR